MPARALVRAALALAILVPAIAAAQIPGTAAEKPADKPAAPTPPPAPEVAPDSPRAAFARFLELARAGRFEEAATYLEPIRKAPARELARPAQRLHAVLDRLADYDLETLSPLATGNVGDELPAGVDRVAIVPGPGGVEDPVRMVRRQTATGTRWLFTRGTLDRVDAWYGELDDRWIRENLPEPLLRPGPRGLLWWQWAALPIFVVLAWLLGRLLGALLRVVLGRFAARTAVTWDDRLLDRTRAPTTLLLALAVAYLALPLLSLYRPAETFGHLVLEVGVLVVLFWLILRALDVVGEVILGGAWATANPTARALVPLLVRSAKVAVIPIALIAVLNEFGYPVASLIAGLGIGGLALALAAQKTVENLFGSVSIGIDQPIRPGDFVRVEDFVGTVETIGLRSTRIRTLDRTLITIPNGRLAEMRLETFAARDRMRLFTTVGLVYGTTSDQMRQVLAGIEEVLRSHPHIWAEDMTVRFSGLGPHSLDITVMAWFATTEWKDFLVYRQDTLLRILEVVEAAGTSVAFPTQTVHLAQEPPEFAASEAAPPTGP